MTTKAKGKVEDKGLKGLIDGKKLKIEMSRKYILANLLN